MPSSNNDKPSPLEMLLNRKSGANNSDCDRPACEDTVSALTSALNRINEKKKKQVGGTSHDDDGGRGSNIGNSATVTSCPPSKDRIGSSSWNLLHSMAAWYPDTPTPHEEQRMTQFMEALAIFYPCTYCAEDFQSNLTISPPQTNSRKDLCVWLCEQHNLVNAKLGKPLFDCNIKKLDERWRKSTDPKCNSTGQ